MNSMLRDLFAAHALQGILSAKEPGVTLRTKDTLEKNDIKMYAKKAYRLADAMMDARGEQCNSK